MSARSKPPQRTAIEILRGKARGKLVPWRVFRWPTEPRDEFTAADRAALILRCERARDPKVKRISWKEDEGWITHVPGLGAYFCFGVGETRAAAEHDLIRSLDELLAYLRAPQPGANPAVAAVTREKITEAEGRALKRLAAESVLPRSRNQNFAGQRGRARVARTEAITVDGIKCTSLRNWRWAAELGEQDLSTWIIEELDASAAREPSRESMKAIPVIRDWSGSVSLFRLLEVVHSLSNRRGAIVHVSDLEAVFPAAQRRTIEGALRILRYQGSVELVLGGVRLSPPGEFAPVSFTGDGHTWTAHVPMVADLGGAARSRALALANLRSWVEKLGKHLQRAERELSSSVRRRGVS